MFHTTSLCNSQNYGKNELFDDRFRKNRLLYEREGERNQLHKILNSVLLLDHSLLITRALVLGVGARGSGIMIFLKAGKGGVFQGKFLKYGDSRSFCFQKGLMSIGFLKTA